MDEDQRTPCPFARHDIFFLFCKILKCMYVDKISSSRNLAFFCSWTPFLQQVYHMVACKQNRCLLPCDKLISDTLSLIVMVDNLSIALNVLISGGNERATTTAVLTHPIDVSRQQ
ncbi:hypothetical protein CEXT_514161 [Caerostris extrusa]|uniref:Uncharacterized protein n=1 Tax=Caerostris extrusa TaxID=172846 RepID=A0AAV4N7T2_CAEEX|nr:hypothetical protein CEXT_514161 [Caerostris extrusa]